MSLKFITEKIFFPCDTYCQRNPSGGKLHKYIMVSWEHSLLKSFTRIKPSLLYIVSVISDHDMFIGSLHLTMMGNLARRPSKFGMNMRLKTANKQLWDL